MGESGGVVKALVYLLREHKDEKTREGFRMSRLLCRAPNQDAKRNTASTRPRLPVKRGVNLSTETGGAV